MAFVSRTAPDQYGYNFIPDEYLPPGKDEYWVRNTQSARNRVWRNLKKSEQEILVKNNNFCSVWDKFLVSDPFDPSLIQNSAFYGLVRIGEMRNVLLQHHDFRIPAGIRNSSIISCDIGDDTAIQDCSCISHYIIGDSCILFRIDEMQTTNHAKFGNGVLKDGEEEDIRIWLDVMNEAGGRSILPFKDMLCADAFLWAAYRDDTELAGNLKKITQKEYGGVRGSYGVVGSHAVIKSCRIIKDVFVGEWAYIKGANKLKNISVLSSEDEPSQIGEGVEMVNGIMNPGCHAFYGIKAVRFVMGRCSNLKYGARLIHSVLGENSTVSCCELLNNLIFPFHEQHHNNSFLIASLVEGISNIAAGATAGSNHNSRANDGEIRAGRGFWMGLSATLKHGSRFACYTLVAEGEYLYELNIPFPFSLVSNNVHKDRLEVMPAYFWMYNLYALERNTWKTIARDKRKIKKQSIETNYLAPDTAEEIISAVSRLESIMTAAGISFNSCQETKIDIKDDFVHAAGLEGRGRTSAVLKPRRARAAYMEMLLYYALKTITDYLDTKPELSYPDFVNEMEAESNGCRCGEWVNLGGQIVPAFRLDELRRQIREGEIDSWDGIHAFYGKMAAFYPLDQARHAWEVYRYLDRKHSINVQDHPLKSPECFKAEMETLILLRRNIAEQVYRTRAKDFDNPFRHITYRNKEEMTQVIGKAEDNSFVKFFREESELWEADKRKLLSRLITA